MQKILILLFLICGETLQAQFIVRGIVLDPEKFPAILANVAVYKKGQLIASTQTDFEGEFEVDVQDSLANLEVSSVGLKSVQISVEGKSYLEIVMKEYKDLGNLPLHASGCTPLIDTNHRTLGDTITVDMIHGLERKYLDNLPQKSIQPIRTTYWDNIRSSDSNRVTMRSRRSDASLFYFDNELFRSNRNPQLTKRMRRKLLKQQKKSN